ncbi:MAG: formate dehydrogenase accessory protein [Methanocella sp. PtaU1.Bin125]|nr:MAG: formate dehydrogenase accessory protein [Methanocella sp. PtaU1.Bin125]
MVEASGCVGQQPEGLTEPCVVTEIVRNLACRKEVDVCVEESVNLLIDGRRIASLTITPADLEAFAYGYLVCEGFAKSAAEISRVQVRWPNVEISMASLPPEDIGLWMEIRSSGCVGIRSSWADLSCPVRSSLTIDKATIFDSMGLINDLASLWRRTGGAHCSVICDRIGGLVSYAEDIGRHTSIDKAVGKALMDGRDLSECFLISTGRMPAGMVAKAYRAGLPFIASNTAPLTSGVELARRLGMTLVCFSRPPRMTVYSGLERITGIRSE